MKALIIAACLLVSSVAQADGLDDARASAKAAPKDANAQFNLGLALMRSIEPQLRAGELSSEDKTVATEADKAYERALKLAPNHGRAHIMLGMLCNFTKQYGRAIPHLKKGLELPRESMDWWIAADTLVNVYFNQNKPAPAREILEQVVETRPDELSAHYKLGLVYFFAKETEKAKREFSRVLELDPSHADARARLTALGG